MTYCLKCGDYITNMESVDPQVQRAKKFAHFRTTDPYTLAELGHLD